MRYSKKNSMKAFLLLLLVIPFFRFDTGVVSWIQNLYRCYTDLNRLNQAAAPLIRLVTDGATLAFFAVAMLLYGRVRDRRFYEAGRSALIGLLSAGALVQILKHLAGRARPRITHDVLFIGPSLRSGYDSFPSGHTAAAFCFAAVLSGYFPRYRFAAYFFAVFVGLSRLNGLSHFPSDLIAGAVVGLVLGKFLFLRLSVNREGKGASVEQKRTA